jgi:preprotein translocase subunit SecA
MNRFGMDENTPLESGLVSKVIESAQRKVEGFNFDRRKQLVEMDDVINVHRDVVYKLRRKILSLSTLEADSTAWFLNNLVQHASFDESIWHRNITNFGETPWLHMVRDISLPVVDLLWMEHLVDMDQIREGIGLRGYAQRDPMVEYKREGHERFEILIAKIYSSIVERISNMTKLSDQQSNSVLELLKKANYQKGTIESGVSEERTLLNTSNNAPKLVVHGKEVKVTSVISGKEKTGRNDPCPCGSGKKYKNCCGKES